MNSVSTPALFVYGTLMVPEVLLALLGRVPQLEEATLEGYRRFALPNECYPAISPDARHNVQGRVLLGLTPSELALLDAYEGDAYVRTTVQLLVDGRVTPAACYVWRDRNVLATTPGDWDLQSFITTHLESYLRGLN